jgi:hypothetical protein
MSDHLEISFNLKNNNMPYLGKGIWAFPHHLLKDKMLREKIEHLIAHHGKQLQQ